MCSGAEKVGGGVGGGEGERSGGRRGGEQRRGTTKAFTVSSDKGESYDAGNPNNSSEPSVSVRVESPCPSVQTTNLIECNEVRGKREELLI